MKDNDDLFDRLSGLTTNEVLDCIQKDWICTTHGPKSLVVRLRAEYCLPADSPSDGELNQLLESLHHAGFIELTERPWQDAPGHAYTDQRQCRRIVANTSKSPYADLASATA